jgi:hypothetical protein
MKRTTNKYHMTLLLSVVPFSMSVDNKKAECARASFIHMVLNLRSISLNYSSVTSTPGNGFPTVPAFRSPLKGFDIAITN